jgi:hypothetical protein
MSEERIEAEIAELRQELSDLELIALPNPPLHPHTVEIALAKMAKLLRQIAELEARRAQGR